VTLGDPITSRSNARVKALRASFSGKPSQPGELMGIEGEHLIAEAVRSGLTLDALFVREGSEVVLRRPLLQNVQAASLVCLSRDVFDSAMETASPQGIAATLALPMLALHPSPRVTLVLEDLQDPGNLGTLLRSAEAFGVQQILATPATVSHWNPKVVRSSAGSVFRIPVLRAPLAELGRWLAQRGITAYAAVVQQQPGTHSLVDTTFALPCAILIGNEGAGLSSAAIAHAQHRVRIPCAVESLNAAVAGSALLYEAMRQQLTQQASEQQGSERSA
jgi:TrmH family RNA methyltransferase